MHSFMSQFLQHSLAVAGYFMENFGGRCNRKLKPDGRVLLLLVGGSGQQSTSSTAFVPYHFRVLYQLSQSLLSGYLSHVNADD
jgi:hypothetical protein